MATKPTTGKKPPAKKPARKAAKKATAGKAGAPSTYTDATAETICARMIEGESLRSICRDDAMPDRSTVFRWLADEAHTDFLARYEIALEWRARHLFDETIEIADDATGDWTKDEDGNKVFDHEHVQRARLRVDTRKWAAGKMLPKKYGDKIQHTGDGGGPIRVKHDLSKLSDKELDALEDILSRAASDD